MTVPEKFTKLLRIHEDTNFGVTYKTHEKVTTVVDTFCHQFGRNESSITQGEQGETMNERRRALDRGIHLHNSFANELNGSYCIACNKGPNSQETNEVQFAVKQLNEEFKRRQWRPLKADIRLRDCGRYFVGKPNLVLIDKNEELVILDYKFGRDIPEPEECEIEYFMANLNSMDDYPQDSEWWKVALKLNLYRAILETGYELPVSKMVFVALDDDLGFQGIKQLPPILFVDGWYPCVTFYKGP